MELNESIDQFVIQTVAAICEMEESQVTLDASLSELALDSLRITALAAHIQATHHCEVNAEDLLQLLEAPRVADVVTIVHRVTHRATSEEV